jgi:16S rRNA C967 or C1407 C5-methylase (RsmB/RsmF family)/NOL1/NOP2/fmu family ribosome biogenesis protein
MATPSPLTFEKVKQLPKELLDSLHGIQGFDQKAFEEVHASGEQITSIRINPAKEFHISNFTSQITPVPWTQAGYYLSQRPSFTFDPLFHAGCYYVQEASSMVLEQALKQLADLTQPLKVLDLCAAPGGKSTHIQSLLSSESLLVSNEVIKSRSNVLRDNIIKWGCENVIITNNDPSAFKKLPGYFDVIVVDAPCSGSGLFRRDEEAINEWSLNNVALCCQRQQRILADVLPALKEGGLLIYSTCSYSKEEDENIEDWLVEEWGLQNETVEIEPSWGVVQTSSDNTASVGYRFFPDKIKGEGFFLACFRKTTEERAAKIKPARIEVAAPNDKSLLQSYLNKERQIIKSGDFYFALSPSHLAEYTLLRSVLNIQYMGLVMGQIMKAKLVPAHALAMSTSLSNNVPTTDLSYDQAILYLQRQDLKIDTVTTGWQLVTFQNKPLGWINALPNRINNYYPKELRILKSGPYSASTDS